jgi:hypothetical protein
MIPEPTITVDDVGFVDMLTGKTGEETQLSNYNKI